MGGFGTKGTPGAIIGTEWNTKQIWLRREFVLPDRPSKNPRLLLIYDEDPEVYLNGVLAVKLAGWTTSYEECDMIPAALAKLKPGRNVLAVHASQTYGGQSIDVGIVEDSDDNLLSHMGQKVVRPDSGPSEKLRGLRKLMDTPLRDTSICCDPDGAWYLTGTVEPFWAYNEGMFIFKANGRYYLDCSEECDGHYSCYIATSTNLYGPYSERDEAIPHAGHNMFSKDERGQWWSTYFGSDASAP